MLGYHIPLGYFVLTLVTLFDPDGRIMEAMVSRFEVDTPFNKMEERERLLATPFGEKDNGSNGSLSLLLVTRISTRKNCVSRQWRLICRTLRIT